MYPSKPYQPWNLRAIGNPATGSAQAVDAYAEMLPLSPASNNIPGSWVHDDTINRSESEEEEELEEFPALNTAKSLKNGIVNTVQDADSPFNVLLVGETGVGKSSVVELLANVISGNRRDDYVFRILDSANEAGGPTNQSQTNEPRLYELHSQNGVVLRALDTPGLADTRGLQQDEIHKRSIATSITKYMDHVNGVIILANGTVPRLTVSTEYALSTLSSMFPKTLADNIVFIFTNVTSPLSQNFSEDSIPPALLFAPRYHFNNPLSLQKKYIDITKEHRKKKYSQLRQMRQEILAAEQHTLDELARFFNWLDDRVRQPTSAILSLYKQSQEIESNLTNIVAQMDQAKNKRHALQEILDRINKGEADLDTFSNFQRTITTKTWSRQQTPHHNTLCSVAACYQNCHLNCTLEYAEDTIQLLACAAIDKKDSDYSWPMISRALKRCWAFVTRSDPFDIPCSCGHPLRSHGHFRAKWVQKEDTSLQIDTEMQSKWRTTKSAKEQDELLCITIETNLSQLDASIQNNTTELSRLADDYALFSLSGSIVAQMEKAIKRLDLIRKNMQENGGTEDQLQNLTERSVTLSKKIGVFKKREAEAVVVHKRATPSRMPTIRGALCI